MKRIILISLFCILVFPSISFCGEKERHLTYLELKEKMLNIKSSNLFEYGFDLSGRKITGLFYSIFVPGTGQFYLGHEIKGATFTILSAGCLITAIISQNNLVAMNERLESLETDYSKANTYTKANEIWDKMLQAKQDADDHSKRKNLFFGIYAGVWALNIFDYLFLSPDKGSKEFSLNEDQRYKFDVGMIQNSPTVSLSINF
jgi:hypothetical protein